MAAWQFAVCRYFRESKCLTKYYMYIGGPKVALQSAISCGILLGVFEGVGVLLGRIFNEGNRPQLPPRLCITSSNLFLLTQLSSTGEYGSRSCCITLDYMLQHCIHSLTFFISTHACCESTKIHHDPYLFYYIITYHCVVVHIIFANIKVKRISRQHLLGFFS